MFPTATYTNRRQELIQKFSSGILLFLGNQEVGMNYKANTYPFRQDSSFLYYNEVILFGDELSMEDIVWEGSSMSLKEQAAAVGVLRTLPVNRLKQYLKSHLRNNQIIHYLPPYRYANQLLLKNWLNIPLAEQTTRASVPFIEAIVAQRSKKSPPEVAEMNKALHTTYQMHTAIMQEATEGQIEAELAGKAAGIALAAGGNLAYPIILSQNGQILHNHNHEQILTNGRLLLGDFGASTAMHYAGDITRTIPVGKRFSTKQREIYEIVLRAENQAISLLKPGITYESVHRFTCKVIVEGLKELGLMKGDAEEAVNEGAHALFFPHGLGHMIGLDVHDMEDLGEQYVGYGQEMSRSKQFGTAYLRLARKLEPGFTLTVEPGIYFIPQLTDRWKRKKLHTNFICYEALKKYRNFGGIRIEDNVLITQNSHQLLGPPIPKTIEAVEALRS
jgi:Xaa-Pro aminopeptidase